MMTFDRGTVNTDYSEVCLELSPADIERIVVVAGDLEFLRDLPTDRLPSHTEVRIAAGIPRRLLVDGQIQAVWRPIQTASKVSPIVETTEIDSALAKWPAGRIFYAWAGGASTSGAHHAGLLLGVIPQDERDTITPENFGHVGRHQRMTLSAWLDSTAVAINTTEAGLFKISRRSLLLYIANRKGGVHFDTKRDLDLSDVKKRRKELEYHLLDHGLLRIGHLSGPEFEVASMARVVAASEWASEFIRLAKEAAPDDFYGDPAELKFWTGMKEADGTHWATQRWGPPVDE